MENIIKTVFDNTVKSYERILADYYPSHGSTGFTERNLTFNFSHNYLLKNPNTVIWQEVPLGKEGGKREHFDTLIIDNEKKSVIILEAKRLGTNSKADSIERDLHRIREKYQLARGVENKIRQGYSLCALLLVDIWIPKENGEKKQNQKDNFLQIEGKGYFSEPINEEKLSEKETYQLGYKFENILKK